MTQEEFAGRFGFSINYTAPLGTRTPRSRGANPRLSPRHRPQSKSGTKGTAGGLIVAPTGIRYPKCRLAGTNGISRVAF